jgi:glycosyltransferase involved in cell wall biosynthesis
MGQGECKKVRFAPEVFLVGPSYPFRGGISHYTTLLFDHLAEQCDVLFYTFKKQYVKWLYPGADDRDHSEYKIVPLGSEGPSVGKADRRKEMRRRLHPLNPLSWIEAGIEARRCRLILIPWWTVFWSPHYVLLLAFARSRTNKVIFLCHNVEEHEGGYAKRLLSKVVLNRGNGFILHSREEERRLRGLLGKECYTAVSHHPIYEVFNKDLYTRLSARKALGIDPGQRAFLFFGFIRRYKGLPHLLKALPIVKTFDPNALLLIVGEVWGGEGYYRDLEDLIRALGLEENIRFVNRYVRNEEVEPYFKASDFVVLPYTEGTGSGIVQLGYAMERAVVTTDIDTFTEIVEDRRTGLTVPPGNEKALAEAIINMYEPGVLPLMEANIREFKKQFEWQTMVESILSLYRQTKQGEPLAGKAE